MRRNFSRYNRQFDTSTAEDDSYFTSDLDLPNPKVTQSYNRKLRLACRTSKNEKSDQSYLLKLPSKSLRCCQDPVINRQVIEAKLFTREVDQVATPQRISNIESSASYVYLKEYEPQGVTFEGKHLSDGEKFERKFNEKNWKQNSTPRIVRAIRQNGKKRNTSTNDSSTNGDDSDSEESGNEDCLKIIEIFSHESTMNDACNAVAYHQQCASHSLNLIASTDAAEAFNEKRAQIIKLSEFINLHLRNAKLYGIEHQSHQSPLKFMKRLREKLQCHLVSLGGILLMIVF
ncbi:PREDICTED: uncharacterized protein LOC105450219 [Wasmannia auropunctata]|uniref:uncharacterized protein LOC105450219 n=1 Tax=Wasmannia auropunctata TaxID=64793 RepID=UPI0005EE00D9|nr:PREDICTED: uncharacterized protein LOC105450219 [Wasmannia auropunctata]